MGTPLERAAGRPYAGKALATRRSEQRERILLAARDVFAARGYAGAGLDEIVSRARVSRTTFYVFYANKEECLLAVFDLGVQQIAGAALAAVAEAGAGESPPLDRVRIGVRAIASAYAADPAMARIVLIEIVGATPEAERARSAARNRAAEAIEAQLAAYPYWRRRSPHQRRVASLAAMAAIHEPISDLVATGRLDAWETLVDPISEFVGPALISPERLTSGA